MCFFVSGLFVLTFLGCWDASLFLNVALGLSFRFQCRLPFSKYATISLPILLLINISFVSTYLLLQMCCHVLHLTLGECTNTFLLGNTQDLNCWVEVINAFKFSRQGQRVPHRGWTSWGSHPVCEGSSCPTSPPILSVAHFFNVSHSGCCVVDRIQGIHKLQWGKIITVSFSLTYNWNLAFASNMSIGHKPQYVGRIRSFVICRNQYFNIPLQLLQISQNQIFSLVTVFKWSLSTRF